MNRDSLPGPLMIGTFEKRDPGITNHTELYKTFTKEKKLVEKERQQKKAKYASIK